MGIVLIRFFMVAVAGLVIDTGIAWSLYHNFGILLTVSSAISFIVAAIINYTMHELWTFRSGQRSLSISRVISYIGVLIITLVARVAAVYLLQLVLLSDTFALLILIIAAGISFFVNFITSKMLVFKSS